VRESRRPRHAQVTIASQIARRAPKVLQITRIWFYGLRAGGFRWTGGGWCALGGYVLRHWPR
jgi:hypothetical protein